MMNIEVKNTQCINTKLQRRLTGRYMHHRLRRLGLRKTAVGLRPLCGFSPPHFAVAGLCFAKSLYATAKRHIPPITLGDINIRFVVINKKA